MLTDGKTLSARTPALQRESMERSYSDPERVIDIFGREREGTREQRPAAEPERTVVPSELERLEATIQAACKLLPPLWTLRNFVAVNPFLGLTHRSFHQAVEDVRELFHADLLMPLSFYWERYNAGEIIDADLLSGLREAQRLLGRIIPVSDKASVFEDLLFARAEERDGIRVCSYAEAIDQDSGEDRWAPLIVDEFSKWCAARYDAGQAAWTIPAGGGFYDGWRSVARHDRSAEIAGLAGLRRYIKRLPSDPRRCIAAVLAQLGVPEACQRDFLARLLVSAAGWAGHVQYQVRELRLRGGDSDALVELLAVRLAYEGALHKALSRSGTEAPSYDQLMAIEAKRHGQRWRGDFALLEHARPGGGRALRGDERRLLWQLAYEQAFHRQLLTTLRDARPTSQLGRPRLQAAFCIDVRSELFRRHLEAQSPKVQTIGFAGFFGFPIEALSPGKVHGSARCPALLVPPHRVRQRVVGDDDHERAKKHHEAFKSLRLSSVSSFPFAETFGQFFALRLLTDSLGETQVGVDGRLFAGPELEPDIEVDPDAAPTSGLTLAQKIDLAEGALRNMGLTADFGEVVLLCGHGSSTTNNPYGSGLDCGACGGHGGETNARVAAQVLDDPLVRRGLASRGIAIPATTRFVAGRHDTTTDTITLYGDAEGDPALADVRAWLAEAGQRTRQERLPRLGAAGRDADREVARRSRDWSEVRPEWGLAGNAGFIAAPRSRTRGVDLGGRCFLHDYDHAKDSDHSVLELIITAPMVVASWINLQYYASTVDNEVFGAGNKVLHNVVGRHGVLTGAGGDLRVGLPWQSVHDGDDYVHQPLRLNVVIEAPAEAISKVLGKHPKVAELVDNGWVLLTAIDPDSGEALRRRGDGWVAA
jgi:uncharacterized protein YbcC (UPF0753/DUF2309 family)